MNGKDQSLSGPEFFAAWDSFTDEVALAFEIGGLDVVDSPLATKQMRYVAANVAIWKLLNAIGRKETAEKFFELAEALQDVAVGLPHPLFSVERPQSAGGRRPDTSAVWRARASLCAGLAYFIAGSGLDPEAAIALVIKEHGKKLSKMLRPGAELKKSIRTWMKSFETDDVQNVVALSNYKRTIIELKTAKSNFSGTDIKQAGERLIARAAERAMDLP
ncbi:hypothetical protein BKD09_24085 [Bradyrhizobium japonicum]|uniref:Uncharacterized protein n=1 Tax=Bradyrhizobium japonicum TaxID=375 RepID=A0A1L3FDM3_BRAJP|nr:hypothetical protein [Bradyrhizobium japonicum]APG11417.1 hypothetical protein BKD09_24085 [Bradyrhizobium japonicum]